MVKFEVSHSPKKQGFPDRTPVAYLAVTLILVLLSIVV
jgi:hypothetical protein